MKYPEPLSRLIEVFRKLPGVGSKSAERFAFQLLQWKKEQLLEMAKTIAETTEKLCHCHECGCLVGSADPCAFCFDERKKAGVLCVIAMPKDAFAIEETREFKGGYHVLGALLSPMEGRGPEILNVQKLKERILAHNIQEVVIALDSTLEGDATALYLKNELIDLPLKISRLAFGLPMGSSLDYVDGGTLARAFSCRSSYQ